MQEKESIICVRYGWTNLSLESLFGITRLSLVMPFSDPWDRFVHPYLTPMSDSYIIHMDTVLKPSSTHRTTAEVPPWKTSYRDGVAYTHNLALGFCSVPKYLVVDDLNRHGKQINYGNEI